MDLGQEKEKFDVMVLVLGIFWIGLDQILVENKVDRQNFKKTSICWELVTA